ncbi:MAG TPA: hypothetical protein VJ203_14240 [Bacteroidales bacterium]|nr:hypothetical protein [Bacteroidales bacterium]
MTSFLKIIRVVVFSCISILLWGCLEYTITTQVLPDGTLLRTITVKGDSANVFRGSFRVPDDSTWEISTRYEPLNQKGAADGMAYVYEARKEFKDFAELNRSYYSDSAINEHISIRVKFDKQFNWFYTTYRYSETYAMLFPFRSVPVGNYLSDAELKVHVADKNEIYYSAATDSIIFISDTTGLPVLSGADSARYKQLLEDLERKYISWQKINIYNDFYIAVTAALNKLGITTDTATAKSSFYNWLDTEEVFESGIQNRDAFIDAASSYFEVSSSRLYNANPDGFDTFSKKFRIAAFSLETYTNRVLMPGMITGGNAREKDVNLATWNFRIDNFYASDYVMTVESRTVNKWFVVIGAMLLLGVIGMLLVGMFRKK